MKMLKDFNPVGYEWSKWLREDKEKPKEDESEDNRNDYFDEDRDLLY